MVLKDLPNLRSFYSSMKNTSTTEANNSSPSRPLFCEKVAFPALEELETSAVGKISGIIEGKQLVEHEENESFWQLRKLPRLRNLYISECSKLKAIVVADKEGGAHNKPLVFLELPSLRVFGIDNLKSVYDNCGPEGEEEKEILEPQPLFNEKVLFSSLEELQLKDLPALTHLWKGPAKLVRLCNLTSLKLNRCDKLESMFSLCIASTTTETTNKIVFPKLKELCLGGLPSFTAISKDMNGIELLQLNKLILWEMPKLNSLCNTSDSNCDTIQPLFNKVLFSSLEELQLKDLLALTNLWKGPTKLAQLCNLTSLKLNRCDKLESMFPLCIARDLMQLQILSVFECRKMEVLISSEEEGDQNEIASTTTDKIVFSKLKELCLGGLPSFTSISKDMNGIELLQLNKLILWEMPKLNSLCNTSDSNCNTIQPLFNKVIFPALEELRIDRLPKITELWYRKLLPSESFRQLRYMTIRNCQELKVIVLENGEEVKVENNNNIISFPQLTSLTLEHLQSLESFCTSRSETQSLFTSQVAFPALEELLISGVPNITEIWGKQFPSELKVNCFEKLMNAVQSNMLPRLQNPRKLSENAKKKAMAQENKRNDDVIVFPRLRTVRLDNLQNLEFFCRTRRFEAQTLFNHQIACPELRVLAIGWVPNITDVWDKKLLPTGSFCQLQKVRIEGCDKLVNVILSNMLPRLQNLTELSVQYCPMVEEILSEKGEEKEEAEAKENVILFPQLETLELGSLENLKSFCTSRLAAQHFFKHPGTFASLKELHISNLPNITEIWGKQLLPVPKTNAQSFNKLAVVNASWCEKLVNVIPSSMFPRLKNLKSIYVKGCLEMEVIVSKKANATVNGDIISFPRLHSLSIDKLYNLKSFCSSSTSEEAQPLFDDQVVFPVLEDLFINRVRNITKIWDKLHSRESFCLLKRMMIVDCEKLVNVVPSNMLPQLQNLEVLNAYSCQKMLAIVSKEEGKEKDVDENTILFPKLTTSNLKSLDNLTTFYTQPFLNCQVYGGELMASPTEAKMYHHTKLNVEPKPEVLSSAPAKLDESNDDESKDSQHSDDNDGISGDTMDLNDDGHDINTSFNTPNAERGIIIAQPSEPGIMDVLIKENQKTWGLVRQWEAKYKQLEESWELRARVIAALEAKLFDQSGPSNMDMDIKNCMEWKDTEIQRLTKLVINLECEKTIVQDLFDDKSVDIITQVEAQKAHDSLKKHPIAALEHIISPPSRVKRIKQKVRKEHRLDEFEYPNLPGQKKGKEGVKEQSHAVQIAQDLDKHPQKKHPTKYKKLTLNNKLKVWANMSKLNKQKVQNLHRNGGDELLVWRGDSKTKDVYFDDIIYIIKEESITNNVIDAYGEILLELQGLVNPSLDDSAFIFTGTCLKIMQEYPPTRQIN